MEVLLTQSLKSESSLSSLMVLNDAWSKLGLLVGDGIGDEVRCKLGMMGVQDGVLMVLGLQEVMMPLSSCKA